MTNVTASGKFKARRRRSHVYSQFAHAYSLYADDALSRSELAKAELEMEVSKVRLEAAGLRDALLKMQALNEGLGQDKVDLNKMLMQVCMHLAAFLTSFVA